MSPYLRLMRLHQPTGIWLLLWPCWWSVTLASPDFPPPVTLALFALGAVLMRSAGCIINDIVDRDIDRQVERTRTRPLASGEIPVRNAIVLAGLLLAASAVVAAILGTNVILWSAAALPLVFAYPWMKRLNGWPQLFLGLTFNWGALVGWVAVQGMISGPAIALYLGCVFWTLGYDTLYAHQDKKDDARIGVRSTALQLGEKNKPAILVFYAIALACWVCAAVLADNDVPTYAILLAVTFFLYKQIKATDLDSPASCHQAFVSNGRLGLWIFLGFFLGR